MGGGGKGGGGGGTSYQTSQIQIPPEVLARYNAVNARAEEVANTPFQPYTGDFVAPVNTYQQTAINQLYNSTHNFQPFFDNAQTALYDAHAAAVPYFGQAANTLNQGLAAGTNLTNAGLGAILGAQQQAGGYNAAAGQGFGAALGAGTAYNNAANSAFGSALSSASPFNSMASQGFGSAYSSAQPFNSSAANLAMAGTGQVNPGALDINGFMSPYNDAVVQRSLGLLDRQQRQEQMGLRDQMIMGGAFGGDRAGVAAANLGLSQDLAYGKLAADLNNQNYSQALGAAQQQQGVGLGAAQANRAALQGGANTIAGIGNQMFNQGLGAAQGQLAVGNQMFGQGLGYGNALAGLGNQAFNQSAGYAQGMAGLGNQVFNQGLGVGQGYMGAGQQLFGQGLGAAGQQAALGSGLYGLGLNSSNQFLNIGQGRSATDLASNQALLGAGTVGQQTDQANLSALYNQFLQQQGYPFQVTQFLANIAQGTGALSGSTTNTVATQPQPYFSDSRLKDDVEEIGRTKDGLPIIRFRYKGSPNTQIGLRAEDVEKVKPDAVGQSQGYKTVDYDAATRSGKAYGGPATVTGNPYEDFVSNLPGGLGAGTKIPGFEWIDKADIPTGNVPDMFSGQSQVRRDIDRDGGMWMREGQRAGLGGMSAVLRQDPNAFANMQLGSMPREEFMSRVNNPPPMHVGPTMQGQGINEAPKASGGSVGNDDGWRVGYAIGGMPLDMNQLLQMHQAMYPGSMNPRGIGSDFSGGTGPRGMQLPSSGAQRSLMTAKTPDMRSSAPAQTGLQQDIGTIKGAKDLYSTGKDIYTGGKDALLGSKEIANPKTGEVTPATGGLLGKGGEWSPDKGWFGSLFDKGDTGAVATEELPPIAETAPIESSGWGWSTGGRAGFAAGGMPYAEYSRLPDELYDVENDEKLKTADAPDLLSKGQQGGKGGKGLGSSLGSLAGMGAGAFFGPMGMALGSAAGGLLGGLFNEGGRVGKDEGGGLDPEEIRRLQGLGAARAPFELTPEPQGLAVPTKPDTKFRHEPMLPRDDLPSVPEYEWRNRVRPEPMQPGSAGLPADQRLPVPPLAARRDEPAPPSAPPVSVQATPPSGGLGAAIAASGSAPPQAPPAGVAAAAPPPQAAAAPALAPPKEISLPPGFRAPAGVNTPDDTFGLMLTRESGNNHWDAKTGGPRLSPAGAVGIAQVMPGTGPEAAKLAGLPWNPELFNRKRTGDPRLDEEAANYNRALGKAYYDEQVRVFGDPIVAAAAYNAGPEAVRTAMAKAKVTGGSYLQFLPQETQAYVAFVGGTGGGKGGPALNAPAKPGMETSMGTSMETPSLTGGQGLAAAKPGFWDKEGWLDRNGERLASSGLTFIGNMLASPSRTLAGSIGTGLAAAAPQFFRQGIEQTGLEQRQQQLNLTQQAQAISTLSLLRQQRESLILAKKSIPPELDAQIAALTRLTMAGVGGGPYSPPNPDARNPDGSRQGGPGAGAAAAPAAGPAPSAPSAGTPPAASLAPPTSPPAATPQPTPATAPAATPAAGPQGPRPAWASGVDPMELARRDPDFVSKLHPEANPWEKLKMADQLAAQGADPGRVDELRKEAAGLIQKMTAEGFGVGYDHAPVKVPGWDEFQASKARIPDNIKWREAETANYNARQQLRAQYAALANIMEHYESGKFTAPLAEIQRTLKGAGLPAPTSDSMSVEDFDKFIKGTYRLMMESANSMQNTESTNMLREQMLRSTPNPGIDPGANRSIIAQGIGTLDFLDARYRDTMKEMKDWGEGMRRQEYEGTEWGPKNQQADYWSRAEKNLAVAGASPADAKDLKEGQLYSLTPSEIFRYIDTSDPSYKNVTIDDVKREFGDKRRLKFRAVKDEKTGQIRLKKEG